MRRIDKPTGALWWDALIAIGILSLWVALAWWHTRNMPVEAVEMSAYRPKPPACSLQNASYVIYDFSHGPRLVGWERRDYIVCPGPDGMVVIE